MKTICGHTFDENNLNSNSLVIDLGANRGFFSKDIIEKYDSNIIAYEPSKHLCENELINLKNKYPDKFVFYNKGVWSSKKTMTLSDFDDRGDGFSGVANTILPHKNYVRQDGRKLVQTYEVECDTLNDILSEVEQVDLLKIDIEGSELEVLGNTENELLSKCKQICLEFHLFCKDEYDFNYNEDSVNNIIKKLLSLGFKHEKTNNKHPDYRFYK